jgi:hypothetical protein
MDASHTVGEKEAMTTELHSPSNWLIWRETFEDQLPDL